MTGKKLMSKYSDERNKSMFANGLGLWPATRRIFGITASLVFGLTSLSSMPAFCQDKELHVPTRLPVAAPNQRLISHRTYY